MAVFYANAQGEIGGLRQNAQEEQQNPLPTGPDATYVLRFDEDTNPGIISAYTLNSAAFAMSGGTLTQNGVAATINAPSEYYEALQRIPQVKAKFRTSDSYTSPELKAALEVLFRLNNV